MECICVYNLYHKRVKLICQAQTKRICKVLSALQGARRKAHTILKEVTMFMIQASNLFFSYTGSPPYVLNDISLEISDGDYVSVVGENGCGKSTLMRLILKFIKPTGGAIESKAKRSGMSRKKTIFQTQISRSLFLRCSIRTASF